MSAEADAQVAVPEGNQEGENAPQEAKEYNCKVVLLGDVGVGKTSLALYWKNGKAPTGELPIITPNYQKDVVLAEKNTNVHIVVWDSACGEDDKEIRARSYANTDVFILCMSLKNAESCKNLIKIWSSEVFAHDKKANIVIVGTQLDSLNIDPNQIQAVTKNIPHNFYIDICSIDGHGIDDLFKIIAEIKADPESHPIHTTEDAPTNTEKKSECCLLI